MKRFLLIIMCVLMSLSFTACGETNQKETGENSSSEATQPTSGESGKVALTDLDESENDTIKTKYCDLQFPKKWNKTVTAKTEEDGHYRVTFSYKDKPCFDLIFDESGDRLLGTLTTDDFVKVLTIHDYSWGKKDKDFDAYLGVMDDVNIIIKGLTKNYDFVTDKIINEDKTTQIKASFATLYYPLRWKENVHPDKTGNTITFTYLADKLFEITYDGKEGSLLGRYDGKDLRLTPEKIDESKYTKGELNEIHTMQEDVNILLAKLAEDEKFEFQ